MAASFVERSEFRPANRGNLVSVSRNKLMQIKKTRAGVQRWLSERNERKSVLEYLCGARLDLRYRKMAATKSLSSLLRAS